MKPGELCPGVGNAHACIAQVGGGGFGSAQVAHARVGRLQLLERAGRPASLFLMRPSASSIPAASPSVWAASRSTLCRGNSLFKRGPAEGGSGRIFVGMAHGGTGSGQGGVAFGHLPAELCDHGFVIVHHVRHLALMLAGGVQVLLGTPLFRLRIAKTPIGVIQLARYPTQYVSYSTTTGAGGRGDSDVDSDAHVARPCRDPAETVPGKPPRRRQHD